VRNARHSNCFIQKAAARISPMRYAIPPAIVPFATIMMPLRRTFGDPVSFALVKPMLKSVTTVRPYAMANTPPLPLSLLAASLSMMYTKMKPISGTIPNKTNAVKHTMPCLRGCQRSESSGGMMPCYMTIMCSTKSSLYLAIIESMVNASCLATPLSMYNFAISLTSPSS